ncbi:MAG: phosphoribosyl-AMP cyclohydrolase [Spirochaetales bacterium]|nr:phosphoribosyl-AMP cyclohydrolase [Spirochaetales bacterium]
MISDDIDFSKMNGLIPVIAQDWETNEILMLAFADKEALNKTLSSGFAHYYSRSRKKLWKKGGSSGHTQEIVEIRVDCDRDTLIYRVRQKGGACHTGYYSCFYRIIDKSGFKITGIKNFDPEKIYTS